MDPVSCAEIKPYAPVMMDKSEEISHLLVRSWYPAQSAQNCLVGEQISRERKGEKAESERPFQVRSTCTD